MIELENDQLRVVVLPEVGGMIHQFIHKASGYDLLFHHPRVAPRPAYYRAPVDDWWSGGVIEGLPTCFACSVNGESIPDFGEVWSEPWAVMESAPSAATIACATRIWPLRITRAMSLVEDAPTLRMRYRIENLGREPTPFLWGVHPTVPAGPDTRIQAAAAAEHLAGDGGVAGAGLSSRFTGGPVHFKDVATPGQRFSYLTDLPGDAWFAIWDPDWPVGFGMRFSGEDMPCVGMWLLEGWRSLRAITLEPWNGWPGALDQAIKVGRARTLKPSGVFETTLTMTAYAPPGPVGGFDDAGRPKPA